MANALNRLSNKKKLRILGINSGTSADGLDLGVIDFVAGKRPKIKVIDGTVISFPRRIKSELERIIENDSIKKQELSRFDIAFGRYIGREALKYLSVSGLKADLIASHGQTIGHFPIKKSTLGIKNTSTIQLGDGNAIASEARLAVVSDFRKSDISMGGEGAPLTPFVNQILFGDLRKSRIIINIGGISNFSYHPAGCNIDEISGGDSGPGNVLSDLACQLMFHKSFDNNGAIAKSGSIVKEVVSAIEGANSRRQVSTGREQFDYRLLARLVHIGRRSKAANESILASIAEATARLIYKTIKKHLVDKRLDGIYITGGGRRNLYIVEQLQKLCKPISVWPIETLKYNGDLLEAISFAVLGGCYILNSPSTLPNVTGASKGGVAGKLSLPPN